MRDDDPEEAAAPDDEARERAPSEGSEGKRKRGKKAKKAKKPEVEADAKPEGAESSVKGAEEESAEEKVDLGGDPPRDEASSAGADEEASADESADSEGTGDDAPPPKDDAAGTPPAPPAARSRWVRGGLLSALGFGAALLMMANEGQLPRGPLLGTIAALIGVVGLLELLGLGPSAAESSTGRSVRESALYPRSGEPLWASPLVTAPLSMAILVGGALAFGYPALPFTLAIALVPLLVSALRRPMLLVFVVAGGLYLPMLGAYGLWDPWETHYGEVAREILSRDDWISLWWAQEDWFWSKPILIFWVEALSMGALGVDFRPDANPDFPEWAIRLPHFLLSTGALLSVYAFVARLWGRRAGVLSALALATMPYFFFLSHQAITDMPFVSTMTMAMAMLGLALSEEPDREVSGVRLGKLTLSGRHLLLGALLLAVVPQALYLISRNVTLVEGFRFAWHGDVFLSGSQGNHGVPGNSAVRHIEPVHIYVQPVLQALLWLGGLAVILWRLRRERRAQALYMIAFYFFCGLAFMAKGIPGFALPGLVALLYLIGARRFDLLSNGHLKVGLGALTVIVVGLPWYVAMFVRHGTAFTDRLLVHDHINRLTAGVHGDTGSIGYFLEQMGVGLFPWLALVPIAFAGWISLRPPEPGVTLAVARERSRLLVALWLTAAFVLFSAMTTKFHHYIFPAVPPLAILIGLGVHRLLGEEREEGPRAWARTALAILAPVPLVLGVAGLYGDVRGVIPEGVDDAVRAEWVMQNPWPTWLGLSLLALGLALGAGAWMLGRGRGVAASGSRASNAATTMGLLAAPAILAIMGRDLSWVTDARPQGYERLIHLFVYNYGRPWPSHFDYRPILTGFAIVATVLLVVASLRALRGVAVKAFIGLTLAFTVFCLNVYMIDLSPHWGQRELVRRYYEVREPARGDEGPPPLLAWQMNWKGENFYTGNRAHVFVQLDNRALNDWLGENRGRVVYFLLEHGRLGNLRGVLRGAEVTPLTTERENNKFVLVRAALAGERAQPSP